MQRAAYTIRSDGNGQTLVIQGDWSSLSLGEEALGLPDALAGTTGPTRLDFSQAGKLDTAGAFLILQAALPTLDKAPLPEQIQRLFDLVRPAMEQEPDPKAEGIWIGRLLGKIGKGLCEAGNQFTATLNYAGHLMFEIGRTLRSPGKLRATPLVRTMEVAGVDALPIVFALNFFIGAVVALVGADLLASLGVSVFTIQLVGIAVVREFAVLFTGIVLAGRSASSFAAQIGSMKMSQEIDAMKVIGVDPFHALVLPRVGALVLMMPILIFAGMIAGIAGGLIVCWLMLDMSPVFFFEQLRSTVPIRHFWIGISKAPLLALLVGMSGCRHGLLVRGDVESLGSHVTSAVVQSIFYVILFDALFAIVFMGLHL